MRIFIKNTPSMFLFNDGADRVQDQPTTGVAANLYFDGEGIVILISLCLILFNTLNPENALVTKDPV